MPSLIAPGHQDGQCAQLFHSFMVYVKGASPFDQNIDILLWDLIAGRKYMPPPVFECMFLSISYNFPRQVILASLTTESSV